MSWQPSADFKTLQARAKILHKIRRFFSERNVLEVETPLMCHTSVTDPYIESIAVEYFANRNQNKNQYYLQTSPEYAMKRLLAAGSGAIYQICKAFRLDEIGNLHNPEFTILEWYQPQYNHHQLMDEVDDFLKCILQTRASQRVSYADLFKQYFNIDIHLDQLDQLKTVALKNNLNVVFEISDKDTWLQLLLDHLLELHLPHDHPIFIYDFPETQSALARINPGLPKTAARFEVYIGGIELANGFHELQNAQEQRQRFEKNLLSREQLGKKSIAMDEFFLSALSHGLPDCAGVALGLDRMIMLATQKNTIADVLSFDISRI